MLFWPLPFFWWAVLRIALYSAIRLSSEAPQIPIIALTSLAAARIASTQSLDYAFVPDKISKRLAVPGDRKWAAASEKP